ncbi:hypothetical protein BDW02DRAFT_377629 [Decorospora gaudefroyi]|uniref:Uncharacterized protein n=1 Tax=Decorospora gaudefroyi TaxID=184978 RepID=A0A6A5KBA1_9PLEO|nr:hypothetical protein BDW02DRAFT_377629 [Decorospora gaudefroyi]
MSFLLRTSTLVRQRLFTTSARARNVISMEDAAAAHITSTSSGVPKLGRVARWYLPTMAMIAIGMIYLPKNAIFSSSKPRRTLTLGDANANIGFGVTNALNEANRKVNATPQLTQEQKNQVLMDLYGERSSLADMERAIAGMDTKVSSQKDRNRILEEAYGDKGSIKDLERAMELYEVQ